jgi:ssDNA thymidine ADP-ribosyltransferase, DarT
MLYAIHKGAVSGYNGSQNDIIYLVTTVNGVAASGTPFVFTDGHAIMAYTSFFIDVSDLAKLDWAILRARYWRDRAPGDDRKRHRQAEFLVYQHFAWELTERIAVRSAKIGEKVGEMLTAVPHQPAITLQADWYY